MTSRASLAFASSALLAGCVGPRAEPPGTPRPIFVENFDGDTAVAAVRALRSRNATLVDEEGVGGSRALRIAYVGTPYGSERMVGTMPLPERGPEYTLNYDVRFDRDFQFVLGGKLHGLGSRRPVAGGEPVTPAGWSARVMWRQAGLAETYTYHQDQADRYGDSGKPVHTTRFRQGRWYAVSLHVRVNTPAQAANGSVRLYVDGALASRQEGLRLRTVETPDSLVSTLLFSTFHGGADPDWSPRSPDGGYATVHAVFDGFAVYRGERIRRRPGG